MRIQIKRLLTIILVAGSHNLFSQDIHFSQVLNSPLILNPSFTGSFDGNWRLTDIYRTQWFTMPVPYNSNAISFDKKIRIRQEKFGLGLLLINDQSGDARLNVMKAYASVAYHKKVNRNQFHFGLQGGYVTKSYSFDQLTFPDQYDKITGYFDPTLPTADAGSANQLSYADINGGIAWDLSLLKVQPRISISFSHLNRPRETFFGNSNSFLPIRKNILGAIKIEANKNFNLTPLIYYSELYKAQEVLLGVNALRKLAQNKSNATGFYGGLFVRTGYNRTTDAVILQTGLNFNKIQTGLSYDINISSLSAATRSQGAIEFSVIYTNLSQAIENHKIPCRRF